MQEASNNFEKEVATEVRKAQSFAEAYHADETLRARAEADPRAALLEHGIEPPSGYEVQIVADTAEECHFVMPPAPNGELSDEYLDQVVGGCSAGAGDIGADEALWTAQLIIHFARENGLMVYPGSG